MSPEGAGDDPSGFLDTFSSGLKDNRFHNLAWELKSLSLSSAVDRHVVLGIRLEAYV